MTYTWQAINALRADNDGQIPTPVLRELLESRKLLGADTNAKTVKGRAEGYATFILYMAPARLSGFQACPMATKGCAEACLNTAGRGVMGPVQVGRIWKAQAFFRLRAEFMAKLAAEVNSAIKSAARKGLTPTFRLNGTTDIRWETIPVGDYQEFANIMEAFPTVQFYDYTKIPNRRDLPANYALTFSYSGQNGLQALWALRNGHNVAVVFRDSATATDALARGVTIGTDTFPVVNGDTDDLRFLDPASHIVALYAKGSAKSDTSGFVNDSPTLPIGSLVTLRASLAA